MNHAIISIRFFLFILFILLISGCDDKDEGIVDMIESPETGPSFEIIHAYTLYEDYFEEISLKKQDTNLEELYQKIIIDSVYEQCFKDGEYLYMVDSLLTNAPKDDRFLRIENIDPDRLDNVIKDALIHSYSLIPTENMTTVCVFPDVYETGAAITVGSGKIILFYKDYYTDDFIKAIIAHEYHHSAWTEKYYSQNDQVTVLDNIIWEGKAVAFEKLISPEGSSTYIYPYYSLKQWESIKPDLNKVDLDRSMEILFGGVDLPQGYGYSVGAKMVHSYLEKYPELTPIEWLGISAEEIYEEIEFPPSF